MKLERKTVLAFVLGVAVGLCLVFAVRLHMRTFVVDDTLYMQNRFTGRVWMETMVRGTAPDFTPSYTWTEISHP